MKEKRALTKAVLILILSFISLFAKEDFLIEKVATLDTSYYDVEVRGDYAFVASNNGLKVLSVKNLKDIREVSFVDSNATSAYDLDIKGDVLYLANASSVKIIDIKDPLNPKLSGEFKNGSKSMISVSVKDGYAYVGDFDEGIFVVDVRNPSSPKEVFRVSADGNVKRVKVSGNRLFVADGLGGVLIFDISDPSSPKELVRYEGVLNIADVAVKGDILYAADEGEGIIVLDISDPNDIEKINFHPVENFGDSIYALKIDGNRLFSASSISGLHVFDVSDPKILKETASFDTHDFTLNVGVKGDLAFVTSDFGLEVIKIDGKEAQREGVFETSGKTWDLKVKGDYAYIIGWEYGLKVVDISNIYEPKILSGYKTEFATDIDIDDEYAYISDDYGGVSIIDIKDPLNPSLVSKIETQGAWGVKIYKDTLFVYDLYEGLITIDVSDRKNPKIVSKLLLENGKKSSRALLSPAYEMDEFKKDIKVKGEYLYVTATDNKIGIISIKDPYNPVYLSEISTAGEPTSLAIEGNTLYAAEKEKGIEVFDISSPLNAKLVKTVPTAGKAMAIAFYKSIMLVADGNSGLFSLEISQISGSAKEESKDYVVGYGTLALDFKGNAVFVADKNTGLSVYTILDKEALDKIKKFVNYLYGNILSREPDPEGFEYWTKELSKNVTSAKRVVKFFFESEEFKSKNLNDEEFIEVLYKTILQREPDKQGASYWLSKLSEGFDRDKIVNSFIESEEFKRLLNGFGIN